jgi:hypothetical protein
LRRKGREMEGEKKVTKKKRIETEKENKERK